MPVFALFSLLLGFRTVDTVSGLTLQPRPQVLAYAVGKPINVVA